MIAHDGSNAPPSVAIAAPANGATFTQGSVVTLTGTATDPEDGALGGAAVVWRSDRDGELGRGPSITTSALSVGTHQITLTATNSKGGAGTASIAISVTSSVVSPTPTGSTARVTATVNAPSKRVTLCHIVLLFPSGATFNRLTVSFSGWRLVAPAQVSPSSPPNLFFDMQASDLSGIDRPATGDVFTATFDTRSVAVAQQRAFSLGNESLCTGSRGDIVEARELAINVAV